MYLRYINHDSAGYGSTCSRIIFTSPRMTDLCYVEYVKSTIFPFPSQRKVDSTNSTCRRIDCCVFRRSAKPPRSGSYSRPCFFYSRHSFDYYYINNLYLLYTMNCVIFHHVSTCAPRPLSSAYSSKEYLLMFIVLISPIYFSYHSPSSFISLYCPHLATT